MTEMIERVAAAMAEATNGGKWDDGHYCEDHKALWMRRAQAAIVAMREPTEAMQNAGMNATGLCHGEIETIFKAMIDAALA